LSRTSSSTPRTSTVTLEAFASGIPVVSTRIGAEGLAQKDGEFCALADRPEQFANKVVEILNRPLEARAMTERARAEVERNWDMPTLTSKLEQSYREVLREKRGPICPPGLA